MSIRNSAFLIKGLLVAAVLMFALPALATTVDGPHWVMANENGGFYAEMTINGGDGGDYIDSITMTGLENCDETKVNNYDCQVFVPQNGMFYDGINSRVLNLEENALVSMTVLLCDGREFSIQIEVRPNGTVATEQGSWDSIKAQYR
jgi:hypothetical protein